MIEPARPRRSDDELREASDHLFYELWMLDRTARLLAMGAFGEGPVRNAILESFTIHARGLIQFFFPKQPRRDDMLAADFLPSVAAWEAARGEMPPVLASLDARVGKEVAHVTYGRLLVTEDAKPWSLTSIVEALNAVGGTFRSMIRDDLLGSRWKQNPST